MSQKDSVENLSQQDGIGNLNQQDIQGQEPASQSHKMSIALTIGSTIALIGLVLFLYGLFGPADYSRSNGINIDLWWGLVMLVFGLLMAIGGYISVRRPATH